MTHLNIQQGSNVEIVSAQVINKLYDTALTVSEPLEGETDTAYMSGHILTDVAYKSYVNYLAGNIGEGDNGIVTSVRLNPGGRFQELRIDVTNGYAIPFEDPNMLQYLLNLGVGSNGLITTVLAATAASNNSLDFINTTDTTVTKFNELEYFTNITGSKGGYNGSGSGYIKFKDWTALEEIDISNFTSIGHSNAYGYEDTFYGCTSLKTVTASNKLVNIGYYAFRNCSNLEDVTGLSGTIGVYSAAFQNCTKLKSSNFDNCLIDFGTNASFGQFRSCTALTSISLTGTVVPDNAFRECSNLTTVNGLSYINTVHAGAFRESLLSNVQISDLSNLQHIYNDAFYGCLILGELNLPNLISIEYNAFYKCPISKIICLNKINSIPNSCFERGTNSNDPLTEVYLPKECTTIGLYAFRNRANLTTIKQYIDSVDNWIEGQTPTYSNVSRVTYIGNSAFLYCTSLLLPVSILSGVTYIGERAFADGPTISVTTLSLPNLTLIGLLAFYTAMPNLTTISDLGSIAELPNSCFRGNTNITSVTLPNTLTTLHGNNFQGSHIKNLIYPEGITNALLGLTYIGWNELLYVEIPTTCTNMSTFFHRSLEGTSTGIRVVVIKAETPPTLTYYGNDDGYYTNIGVNRYLYIYVPDNSLADYRSATGAWLASAFSTKLRGISNLQTDFPAFYDIYNDPNNQYHNGILT